MVNIESTLKKIFSGTYSLTRNISPQNILCEGEAIMKSISDTEILYEESGIYPIKNTPQRFHQKQFFIISTEDFLIEKFDRTLLHQFKLVLNDTLPLELNHKHHCKDDVYSVIIKIPDIHTFTILYTVKGPCKNYEIVTKFIRK